MRVCVWGGFDPSHLLSLSPFLFDRATLITFVDAFTGAFTGFEFSLTRD